MLNDPLLVNIISCFFMCRNGALNIIRRETIVHPIIVCPELHWIQPFGFVLFTIYWIVTRSLKTSLHIALRASFSP